MPKDEPIGEAYVLSDREGDASVVLGGNLKGYTLTELLKEFPEEIMGYGFPTGSRFPLLLKFLDCKEVLSVQVHPSDNQKKYISKGNTGKTEAWVVLETGKDSRIYAGLKKGTTKEDLLKSIQDKSVSERLHSFVPKVGDAVFIRSGTVHTLAGTVVFEIQENSDVTFRLYDWDRKDAKTGKPRNLQVDNAIACIDFDQVNIGPITPVKDQEFEHTEKIFDNEHFMVWRKKNDTMFTVGFKDEPSILACTEGKGAMNYDDNKYAICKGEVMLLPASIGQLDLQPEKEIELLQIAIPDKKLNEQK